MKHKFNKCADLTKNLNQLKSLSDLCDDMEKNIKTNYLKYYMLKHIDVDDAYFSIIAYNKNIDIDDVVEEIISFIKDVNTIKDNFKHHYSAEDESLIVNINNLLNKILNIGYAEKIYSKISSKIYDKINKKCIPGVVASEGANHTMNEAITIFMFSVSGADTDIYEESKEVIKCLDHYFEEIKMANQKIKKKIKKYKFIKDVTINYDFEYNKDNYVDNLYKTFI